MSYTAPAGNAVDFIFDGASYIAPAGTAVSFSFGPTFSIHGGIAFGGATTLAHGVMFIVANSVALGGVIYLPDLWHGDIQVGGLVGLIHHAPPRCSARTASSSQATPCCRRRYSW